MAASAPDRTPLAFRPRRRDAARRGIVPRRSPLVFLALSALALLYMLAPLAYGLSTLSGGAVRSLMVDPQAPQAALTSFGTASVSTLILAVLAVPLAHALSHARGPLGAVINVLVALPLALPPLMSGILLLLVFGPYGLIGGLLSAHGVVLSDSLAGVMLAQTFVAAPFTVVGARSAFRTLEPEIEEAAAVEGAGPWAIFRRIALPLAWPGVAAALLLGWLRALGEFGATVVLAYHPYTLPVYAWVQLSSSGLDATLPIVALMLALTAVVVGALGLWGRLSG